MIEQSFSLYSNNTAIIDSNGRLSYSHLGHAVKNLAQRLRDAGICQNDLIAIESRGRDLILLTLAVMQSGACAAAVPDQLAEHEKRSPMDKCFITAVISSGNSCLSEPLSGDITAPDLTGRYFITRITQKLPPALLKSRLLKNAAILRFTSGTTGDSKGVLFTRRSITERVAAANKALGINEQDIVLWVLPMAYHFIVSILLYLSAGACIILPDNNSPEALKKAL